MVRRLLVVLLLGLAQSLAAEVPTLKAVSAFPAGYRFSKPFEQFIEGVNAGGSVNIHYLGGGSKVLNPYELGQYVRKGLIDIAHMPSAYYKNILPEADAIKMCYRSMPELRTNGGWRFINDLHVSRMNVFYLARAVDYVPYHLYLIKPLNNADLTGYRIRVSPVYTDFFEGLGASVLRSTPGEAYTLLERSVIDGLGWPLQGFRDFGFEQVVRYRVDPGFYRADIQILVNWDRWQALTPAQRSALQQQAHVVERAAVSFKDENVRESTAQKDAGISTIELTGSAREAWVSQADAYGWAAMDKINPTIAAQYRAICERPVGTEIPQVVSP